MPTETGLPADLARNLTLLVPLAALLLVVALRAAGVLRRRPHDVPYAGLAALLVWVGVLAVEQVTALWSSALWSSALWSFAPGPTSFLGVPMETSLGWAIAWGVLPVLAGGRLLLWWGGLAWVDVLVMPRLEPLVVLSPHWWLGELLLLVGVLGPALLLGRSMQERSRLGLRVALQGLTVTAACLWLVPTVAFGYGAGSWSAVVDHSLPVRSALLAGLVLLGVPVLAAVAELARVGRGTPYPWDPPERLVTTGPYAYLANPMQAGVTGILVLLAVAAGSPWLLAAAVVAAVFSVVVAAPHEEHTMRDWAGYDAYRLAVRSWLPRRAPYVPEPCDLWMSRECGTCRATAEVVRGWRPTGLRMHAAEEAGVRLTRMQWVGAGTADRGVAAFARALEHAGLGRAWLGWLVRLPGVTWVVQTAADACGLGPREVRSWAPREDAGMEQRPHTPAHDTSVSPGRADTGDAA